MCLALMQHTNYKVTNDEDNKVQSVPPKCKGVGVCNSRKRKYSSKEKKKKTYLINVIHCRNILLAYHNLRHHTSKCTTLELPI